MTTPSIPTAAFVHHFTQYWTRPSEQGGLGNHASLELQRVWQRLGHTFNQHIADAVVGEDTKFRVCNPATGSGKTTGLAFYCSMLAQQHPTVGALLIVRLISQADGLARSINELAQRAGVDRAVAIAKHGNNDVSPEVVAQHQVLVITHAKFTNLMDKAGAEEQAKSMEWMHGRRLLRVVDESLALVSEAKMTLDDIKLVDAIPEQVLRSHPSAAHCIESFRRRLKVFSAAATQDPKKEAMVWSGMDKYDWDLTDQRTRFVIEEQLDDLAELRKAVRTLDLSAHWTGHSNAEFNKTVADKVVDILTAIETSVMNYYWYSLENQKDTLHTSRLVLPECVRGAVVLDATADQQLVWRLWEERAEMVAMPTSPRRYGNATLHVTREDGLGKRALAGDKRQRGKVDADRVSKLYASIAKQGTDRRVLVVTKMDVEEHFKSTPHPFKELDVTHYGEVDGRNDWSHFDTVLIYGLNYLPSSHAANVVFAVLGAQPDEWFRNPEMRTYGDYSDIRRAIEQGELAGDLLQAINRICTRR